MPMPSWTASFTTPTGSELDGETLLGMAAFFKDQLA